MSDDTGPPPLKKFAYPFPKTDAASPSKPKAVEVDDPQTYYSALAKAEDGFYPVGANGQWHGGIHFDGQTGAALSQDGGVRCIADGEVIAWRVDGDSYPEVAYQTCGAAKYSTGFSLVRHRLQLPPAPKPKSSSPASSATTAPVDNPSAAPDEPSLVFYSLYMHLLYWRGYRDESKKPRPAYWGDPVYLVGDNASDSRNNHPNNPHIPEGGVGLNLRNASGDYCGFAPRGTKLRLGAESARKEYYAVTGVVSGNTVPADVSGATAYKGELTASVAEPSSTDSVVIPGAPIPVKAGDLMGYLGEYQRYGDMNPLATSCTSRSVVHLEVFTHEDIDAFLTKSRARDRELDAKQKTLLVVESGAMLVMPAEADLRLALGEGVALAPDSPKTGDWVKVHKATLRTVTKTSLGNTYKPATRTYGGDEALVRIVGATDADKITVEAYNALSKEQKQKYPRREVVPAGGSEVWARRAEVADKGGTTNPISLWSRYPLQLSNAQAPAAGFPRVIAIKNAKHVATEADGTRWWEIVVGTADGARQTGWVREKDHAKVSLCSPWAWPGFQVVKGETSTPAELYARQVVKQQKATPDEEAALTAKGKPVDTRPVFSKLYEIIDQAEAGKKDGQLSSQEIRKALATPWLAQAISRLIVEHESEWSGPMSKWDEIDQHIPESRKGDWEQEKKRIKALQWWSEVGGVHGFPVANQASCFHPVGLVDNFTVASNCCELNLTVFKSIFGGGSIFNHRDMPRGGDAYDADLQRFVDLLNAAFAKYGFDKCVYKYHFLSQCYHESDHFNTTQEYASGRDYDLSRYPESVCKDGGPDYTERKCKRRRQIISEGNTTIGDGPAYKGKGIIQLTWKGTYQAYKDYSGIDVVTDPLKVAEDLATAVDSAFWFWALFKGEHLNQKIDRYYAAGAKDGLSGDALDDEVVRRLTRIINGGARGLSERQALYKKIREAMQ